MIDPNAPGRTNGIFPLFQRLRCGGEYYLMRGHDFEWVRDGELEYERCPECGQIRGVREVQETLESFAGESND